MYFGASLLEGDRNELNKKLKAKKKIDKAAKIKFIIRLALSE